MSASGSARSSSEARLKAACALVDAGERRGSSFLVHPKYLVTCAHVVSHLGAGGAVSVRFSEEAERPARVARIDAAEDCALLELEQPVTDIAPLSMDADASAVAAATATATGQAEGQSDWECYGFPAATHASGLLLRGRIHDSAGQDLRGRRSLVLSSANITAGARLQGFSGSAVVLGGRVIGLLRQVIPDDESGAQFGLVYACPVAVLRRLCGALVSDAKAPKRPIPPPASAYDAAFYIARPDEEERARDALEARGAAVVFQAPEMFGKTWLLRHLLAQLRPRGRVAYVDLKNFDRETLTSFSAFMRELGRQILEDTVQPDGARALVDQAWSRSGNANDNLSWLMERWVLPALPQDHWLLLCIDGADCLASQPYVDDFFSVLRYFTQNAAQPPWTGLKLLMTLSTAPSLVVRDLDQSPFNVAYTVQLRDFEGPQLAELARLHGLDWSPADCQPLMELVGGHPYLARLALYEAGRTGKPLERLLAVGSPLFSPFLEHCQRRLRRQPELWQALLRVLSDPHAVVEYEQASRLRYAGLLIEDEETGEYRPRYPLYRRLLRGPR